MAELVFLQYTESVSNAHFKESVCKSEKVSENKYSG